MVFIKTHRIRDRNLLAIADENLVGNVLEDGDISFTVDEHFYSGEIKGVEEVRSMLKNFNEFNAIGSESVKILIDAGIIEEKEILQIGGVPHACVSAF